MIDVSITIDTEFSIGGSFEDPIKNKPVGLKNVYCEVDGKSNGLGFILGCLNKYNITGTFFVETLNKSYFGSTPMKGVVDEILRSDHSVELHLHPVWQQIFTIKNWEKCLNKLSPNDSVLSRTESELDEIISTGIEIFSEWSGHKPTALRTGNLHSNRILYDVMAKHNIFLGSNVALGTFFPEEKELQIMAGCRKIGNVIEFPVTTFKGVKFANKQELKSLTVTGTSFAEMKYILDFAWQNNISPIVFLTHPFEFIKGYDHQLNNGKANKLTQSRLLKLCSYLQKNNHKYRTVSFSGIKNFDLSQHTEEINVPSMLAIKRVFENKISDYSV